MKRSTRWLVGILLGGIVSVTGCEGQSNRLQIDGEVVLDGRPLEEGTISLSPLGGGFSAGGAIQNGKFLIAKNAGPSPGKYRVEIESYRPTGKKLPDPDLPGRETDEVEQIIPQNYNRQSQLVMDLPSPGPIHFDLKSR